MDEDRPPSSPRRVENEPVDARPPDEGIEPAPHDLVTEKALLGAALLSEEAANIAAALPAEAWYSPAHQHVAGTIAGMLNDGLPVEPNSVHGRLLRDGLLDLVGGHGVLLDAVEACGVPGSARAYAQALREMYRRRQVLDAAYSAIEEVRHGSLPTALGHLEAALDHAEGDDRAVRVADLLDDHIELIERRHAGEIITIPTGLADLDHLLGGLRLGELTVAAGRPGMGKTILGGGFALHVASTGHRVLFASLEMSTTELLDRWIGGEGRINTTDLQQGRLDDRGFRVLADTVGRLADLPLWVLDRPEATVPVIRAEARAIKAELVVIDYLGLISPVGRHSNRQEEVASIARSLKAMARVLDCPVFCLAQLNRGVEARQEKRPLLSDLRESGEIEQSAGVVLGLYRDDYYDRESEDHGLIEVSVLKNRHGPLGTVKAAFLAQTQRIANATLHTGPGRAA